MKTLKSTIDQAPKSIRLASKAQTTFSGTVDRKARVIRGYSVITAGEALGHDLWIDREFMQSVAAAGNSSPSGIKSRFAHPGLSSDGIGSALGRSKNFSTNGPQVFADLHLLKAAEKSPQGDIAGYTMDLAEEAPDLFAASIAFDFDPEAEDQFMDDHTEKGSFHSPDPDNAKNLPHVRLAALHASDFVDDAAANPGGLFSALDGNALPAAAEEMLLFALGFTEDAPEENLFGVHPERIRRFIQGFLERHFLTVETEPGVTAYPRTLLKQIKEASPPATLETIQFDPGFVERLERLERRTGLIDRAIEILERR